MAGPVTADVFTGPALPLLLQLEAEGFDVVAERDRLRVRPPARLTPELLTALRQHKSDLLILVRCCDAGVTDRVAEFRRQIAAVSAPRCPAFLFRSDVPYVRGVCFSCGDAVPEPRFSRCWRCSLAWRLACRLPVPATLADALDTAKVCA